MARLIDLLAVFAALAAAVPSPQSLESDLTILINNDLQGKSSPSANSSVILLDHASLKDAAEACKALGEQLWSPGDDMGKIEPILSYLVYQEKASQRSQFWIEPNGRDARSMSSTGDISYPNSSEKLPVLCTQTAPFSSETVQDTSVKWQVQVRSNNETLTGFRDRLSFRFLGVRYAPQPERFTYSEPYEGSGNVVDVTQYGSQCAQSSDTGTEDCLFLNIWTSYLPQHTESKKRALKPVMFWIHGGAFTSGTANDATMDGGNIVSRGDVVLVNINYRLSTLGFLALDDGITNGNFGLQDQINALDWVRKNIADFGGDPDNITIFGQSAGAGSVRALMESSKSVGKFARAIPLSNLGGINYGTTYSKYYTIEQEVKAAAIPILEATNCTDASSHVDCLRQVDAHVLTSLSTVARFLVVDGTYLTHNELQLDGAAAPYDLMMGIMRDDGAPFIPYPSTTDEDAYLAAAGFSVPDPALFPIPDDANATYGLYNMSSRLATDGIFRCIDQATVLAGLQLGRLGDQVYYYEFDRSYQVTGWPNLSVCEPPRTTTHPNGDPSLEYFKCHSGELYYVFGNLARQDLPMRDEYDLPFEQLVLDSFAAFARTGNPNPDTKFLEARGFVNTIKELNRSGQWEPARKGKMTMRVLDWPSYQGAFRELPQCKSLGLGLDYYLTS